MNIVVHTDGGARGNPGPAAVGIVIEFFNANESTARAKHDTVELGKSIGETTNNVAEYMAVLEALRYIKNHQIATSPTSSKAESKDEVTLQFFIDSSLIVNQLNGMFKVKDPDLRNLLFQVRLLEQEIGRSVHYILVPREQNRRADFLVKRAQRKNFG